MNFNKNNKLLSALLVFCVMFSANPNVANAEEVTNEDSKYLETRDAISLENLDITEDNKGNLDIDIEDDLTRKEEKEAEENLDDIDFMISRYGDSFEDFMLDIAEESEDMECIGISYSECPLKEDSDGNLVRIEKDDVDSDFIEHAGAETKSATGDTAVAKGKYFTLVTSISRPTTYYKSSEKSYVYTVKTKGIWSKNSFVGGEKYPDAGDDFICQSWPSSFEIKSNKLTCKYNLASSSKYGENGDEYGLDNIGTHYLKYWIKDDPSYYGQLDHFTMTTTFYGKNTDWYRRMNSVYTHTWKKLSIKVSVTVTAGKSGSNKTESVAMTVTPSIEDKSWNLPSYVTFDF